AKAPVLIDVGRSKLPGEVSWWFLTPEHTTNFAADVAAERSLVHRVGMIYIGCLWHHEQGRVLPEALLRSLTSVLVLQDIADDDSEVKAAGGLMFEGHCDAIVNHCKQRAEQRALADERRRRAPEFQP